MAIIGFLLPLMSGWDAQANSIVIANTGVGSTGTLLAPGSSDPLYPLTGSPTGSASSYVVDPDHLIGPPGPWVADSAASEWIGPVADQSNYTTQGIFDYRMTFSLTGLNPATAIVEGNWSSDNQGVIELNGHPTGNSLGFEEFGVFSPFSITTGFVSGTNTLDFIVTNSPGGSITSNPTGLNVEFTQASAAASTSIAEPSTGTLIVVALTALSGLLFRRARVSK